MAAPPDVGYPTYSAAAPDGTVFVGIDENGSLDAKLNRGRIVRCTDGEGKADKFTVFAPNVDSPRGVVWDGKTFYLLHPPFIRAFHDDDGVAERSEVLVQGLGYATHWFETKEEAREARDLHHAVGLIDPLTVPEFASILAYLESLQKQLSRPKAPRVARYWARPYSSRRSGGNTSRTRPGLQGGPGE